MNNIRSINRIINRSSNQSIIRHPYIITSSLATILTSSILFLTPPIPYHTHTFKQSYSTTTTTMSSNIHTYQQPTGHVQFPLNEYPIVQDTLYCYVLALLGKSENYSYVLIDKETGETALVDPAESDVVLNSIQRIFDYHSSKYNDDKQQQLQVTHILATHKHWDHSGGNNDIYTYFKKQGHNITVVGGINDNVEACTRAVRQGDSIQLGSTTIHVYDTPCHTAGHVLYHTNDLLFTGDTMFSGGCGRFFEGDAKQMHHALYTVISQLNNNTIILPGHEYTLSNLEFCTFIEPNNDHIKDRLQYAKQRKQNNLPAILSTLQQEKQFNTFIRANDQTVQQRVCDILKIQSSDLPSDDKQRQIALLGYIRQLKDQNKHKSAL